MPSHKSFPHRSQAGIAAEEVIEEANLARIESKDQNKYAKWGSRKRQPASTKILHFVARGSLYLANALQRGKVGNASHNGNEAKENASNET